MRNLIRSVYRHLWPVLLLTQSCSNTISSATTPVDDTLYLDTNASMVDVKTIIAKTKPFNSLIISNGKIQSLNEQLVLSPASGVVQHCMAETGKHVTKGSLIALLDTISASIQLRRARLNQYNYQKEYESQLLAYRNLLEGKSQEQSQEIKKKLQIASGLATAEEDIHDALYMIEKAHILAPFSGILAQVKVQQGKYLNPGDELFRIYDPKRLGAKVKVLESATTLLRKGMKAEVIALFDSTLKTLAQISAIDPYIDDNGLVSIELELNAEKTFIPGMNCVVRISILSGNSIVVPRDAVVKRSDKDVVFTLENGEARWSYVITGRDNGEEIEIMEGLQEGQRVIITNNLQLSHNSPVREVK